jgi:hypothetical protein
MEEIIDLLRTDCREENSLGALCGPGKLFPVFPANGTQPPAVSYGFSRDGHRAILTIIVWAEQVRPIHGRIRDLLTKPLPRFRIKYLTAGPQGWDQQLGVFTQRATYLVKTLPVEKIP